MPLQFPFTKPAAQPGVSITRNSVIYLTSDGSEKANTNDLDGDLGNIISALSGAHTAPVSQLEQLTGISDNRIIEVIRQNPVYLQVRRVPIG